MVKCYNHPYISAIGSCIVCNKNLCEFCAYIINGKIYCKDHANEILIKKVSPKKISIPKLTSNLFFLIGITGIIMIFLIVITFHAGFIFYFLAGYWIRERKRRGVALGAWLIIMSIIGTLHYLSELRKLQYFPIELTEILIIGGLVIFRIFLIILLIICWKEFKIF